MRIVSAALEHVPEIMAIYNEAVLNSTATFDMEPKTLLDRQRWLTERGQAYPVIVALDDNDAVLGWGSLEPYAQRPAYRSTVENSVYIRQDSRGQGIGTALLSKLLDLAAALGYHSVVAKITQGNEASIRLHTSLGFTFAGTLHEVGRKFDRWLDVALLQKNLEPR